MSKAPVKRSPGAPRKVLPLLKEMCATCPFREGSPYAYLMDELTASALSRGSRICHSTGKQDAIPVKSKGPPMLCRGARDMQLKILAGIKFLDDATDEAWERKQKEMGLL